MKPKIPKAIQHGHEHLCEELKEIIAKDGEIGEKAKILEDYMNKHFIKEEEYALPPLGLLLALSEGDWELDPTEAIKMSDTLQEKLEEMTKEHAYILKLLKDLEVVANKEDDLFVKQFIKNLRLHAELEDQVLYPATLLIGNYLKHMKK